MPVGKVPDAVEPTERTAQDKHQLGGHFLTSQFHFAAKCGLFCRKTQPHFAAKCNPFCRKMENKGATNEKP